MNYNSDSGVGTPQEFVRDGIIYDREGRIEPSAGETVSNTVSLDVGLSNSLNAGMIPDVLIDPTPNSEPAICTGNADGSGVCLPRRPADIQAYVAGFIQTARSVISAFPGKRVLFEPMDEPWDFAAQGRRALPSGRVAASQYAAMVAELLPAAVAAGIPVADIYIPATGRLQDGSSWVPDLYAAQPCLAPNESPCAGAAESTPIEAWNVHPYGPPNSTSHGIESVPGIRAGMRSGEDNVIVSEIGFCDIDVDSSNECRLAPVYAQGTSNQVAAWLNETLQEALPMHRAGWLKALIVWSRNEPWDTGADPPTSSGWAMQGLNGSLTPDGKALVAFAERYSRP
jgi:hypothetical protein